MRLTLFPDLYAKTMQCVETDWPSLRQWFENPPIYSSKRDCPLIKLAEFGDLKSDPGDSLRHDKNMLRIWGVEGDHDAGTMQPAQASELLRAAGLQSIVYTSASHSPDAPRWRVLVPLSRDYPSTERKVFIEQLNGVLAGALTSESFTNSQAFYCGRVQGVPYEVY